jgi:hypothetical protein
MTVQTDHHAASAEVVVLTATVRALMVGSRQVTLSVFAQLDSVDWDEIQPMGRVHPRNAGDGWSIGAEIATGDLVRCQLETIRDIQFNLKNSGEALTRMEREYRDTANSIATHPQHWAHETPDYLSKRWAEVLEFRSWVQGQIDHLKEVQQQHVDYQKLPLIVLAGLR